MGVKVVEIEVPEPLLDIEAVVVDTDTMAQETTVGVVARVGGITLWAREFTVSDGVFNSHSAMLTQVRDDGAREFGFWLVRRLGGAYIKGTDLADLSGIRPAWTTNKRFGGSM